MTKLTEAQKKQGSALYDKLKADLNQRLEVLLTEAEAKGQLSTLGIQGVVATVVTILHSLAADIIFDASTSGGEYLADMASYNNEMQEIMKVTAISTFTSMSTGKRRKATNDFFASRTCQCAKCREKRGEAASAEGKELDEKFHAFLKTIFGEDVTIIPVPMNDEEPQKH